jgi:cell wall-associated NlpC family hydrolase
MNLVHALAGVAGDTFALDSGRPASPSSTTTSSTLARRNAGIRIVAVLACALGIFVSTAAGSLAGPGDPAEATEYTYLDMGYDDPNEAVEAMNQTSGGQVIVDFALQFQGYPYVYAGNTPAGFDCSGFTQYVILNTLGIDIGHGVAEQTGYGAWVDWGAWQPGDLVYFAGTYRAGISHTGVYIGDGQFIHAENEGTGVVISSIYSDYYSGHYYGAYRLW